MSKPTQSIFPIENGRLITPLDCNNLQLLNLDESNLSGGGGSGNDTGTTMAILKGDGNHGFADAIGGTDYATPASLSSKEDQSAHDADILTLTTAIDATEADIATLTTAVGTKASTTALTNGLALKADDADLQAYITSNDADVALKAYSADITTALGDKADSASVSAALAGKEPLLPTTVNDRYILARRNASGTDAWFFVDPTTLGTTSQSFTDGVENSSTTFTSATANFVAGDVGKTITGDNIPAATTIASRTNSTTIILSAAATATGSSKNFTILNRLEVGGTGTVTSVGFTNNVTNLLDSSSGISNPTTSPTLTLNPATVGANTFYGNFTGFAGLAAFGSAPAARAALGGTAVGQALFQLANPGAVTFPQFTALNGAVTRTPAQVLSDIGGESALTFNSPLARATNTISIPAATSLVPGHLTTADFQIFTAKVPNARNINTAAPLTGGGSLITDRTIAMPAATASGDGYLAQGDFITFTAKPPNTRTISTNAPLSGGGDLSANRTLSMAKATTLVDGYLASADFNSFANQVPIIRQAGAGGTLTLADVTPPITRVILNAALTSPLTINLPQSVGYGFNIGYPFIEIVDIVAGGAQTIANRVTISRTGATDLLDGTTSIQLPMGALYTRINSNGLNRWISVKYFVDSIRDPLDGSRQVRVVLPTASADFPTITTRTLTLATADSVTVAPFSAVSGQVLRGINNDGSVSASALTATEIVPQEATVGNSNDTVSPSGQVDTVKLNVTLTLPRTYTFPSAIAYSSGEVLRFYDSTGSITSTNSVTVTGPAGTTFNGNSSISITESFFNRIFVADPINNNWTVSTFGGTTSSGLSLDTWHDAPVANGFAGINCSANVVENHHIVRMSGALTLMIAGAVPGSTGRIKFRDSTGNHTVTVPPAVAKTPNAGGLGLFITTTGTNVEDEYGWDYDGTYFNFFPLGLNMVATAPAFSNSADDTTTALTSDGVVKQANNTSSKFVAARLVADGGITDGSTYTIGKVEATLTKNGTGGDTNINLSAYTDTGTNVPNTIISTSDNVLVSPLLTSEQVVPFALNFTPIGARLVTSIATVAGGVTLTGTAGQFLPGDVGCKPVGANMPAAARIVSIAGDGSTATLALGTGVLAGTANLSVKHIYWLVLTGDNTIANTTNNMSWHFHTSTGDSTGRCFIKSATGGWTVGSVTPGTSQLKYITYK